MDKDMVNPLTEGELEGAAYLCLHEAAYLDRRNQFPQGSGETISREHHARRGRFLRALELVRSGAASLSKLGLSHRDCVWAVSMAHRAKNQGEWRSHFQAAEEKLKQAEEAALAQP